MYDARRSVLLVEDSREDREVVIRYLESRAASSLTLVHAETVREALDHCASGLPDCILSDYRLPDGDGLELLHALRQRCLVPPPFVMLTSKGDEHVAVRALKLGAADYVVKGSVDADQLYITVLDAIERAAVVRQEGRDDVTATLVVDGENSARGRVRHLGSDRVGVRFDVPPIARLALGDELTLRLSSSQLRRIIDTRVVVTAFSERGGEVELECRFDRSAIVDELAFERLVSIVNRRAAVRVRPSPTEPVTVTLVAAPQSIQSRLGGTEPRTDQQFKGSLVDISGLGLGVSAPSEAETCFAGLKALVAGMVLPPFNTPVILACRVRNRRIEGRLVHYGMELMPATMPDFEESRRTVMRYVTRRQSEVLQGRLIRGS